VLLLLHWAYFLLVLAGGVILAGIALLTQALTSAQFGKSMAGLAKAHAFADDGLQNADVLEGMGMSSTFVTRWRRLWLDSLRSALAASDRDARFGGTSKAVRQLIQMAVLGLGALLVLQFNATGGVMIAASILSGRALAPIEALVGGWKSVIATRLAWGRLV